MIQDEKGFLWVGTDNGLYRYDGGSFKQYQYVPGKSNVLSNDFIMAIARGDNNLFIGTQNGFSILNLSDDSVTNYFNKTDQNSLGGNSITSLICYNKKVWIVSDNFVLTYFDPDKKLFQQFPLQIPKISIENYISITVKKVIPDIINPDFLWISSTYGLYHFNIINQTSELMSPPGKGYFNILLKPGIDICQTKDGIVWMAGPVLTLFSYDPSNLKWESYTYQPLSLRDVKASSTLLVEPYSSGYLLVFTQGAKLQYLFDIQNKKYVSLRDRLRDAGNETVYTPAPRCVYKDNYGIVWFGHGSGFSRIINDKNPFAFFHFIINSKPTANNNFPQVFLEDTASYLLYIGTRQGDGLLIQDQKQGSIEAIHSSIWNDSLKYDVNINDMTWDEDGAIWLATLKGLFKWKKPDKIFYADSSIHQQILSIENGKNGLLYIGTPDSGLIVMDQLKRKVIKHFLRSNSDLYDNRINVLERDRDDNIWIGTNTGINILYASENKVRAIDNKLFDLLPYDRFKVVDIKHDGQNRIWISTQTTGIFCIEKNNDSWRIKSLNTSNGLPDNNVGTITIDRKQHLWAGMVSGIVRIIPGIFTITLINVTDGLHFINRVGGGKYVLHNGNVLLSGNRCYEYFNPDSLFKQTTVPLPYIFSFTVQGSIKNFYSEIQDQKPIILPYSENRFEVELGVLDFTLSRKIQFQYRLKGYNNEWITTFNRNYLNYINLPPGNYTLEYTAINLKAAEKNIIHQQEIIILKAWWQTWWFRILCLLIAVATVFVIWKNEQNKIARKQQIREKEIKLAEMNRQMNETRLMAIRAQMNPHFIFNSLNSIQKFIVVGDVDSSYQYLSKFSKLLRQVLDNSEKNFILLSQEIEMNRLYLELESLRFKHNFQYHFLLDQNVDPDNIMIPSLLLQPFIENAIWHGLMNKEGEKKLEISFSSDNNRLQCEIIDNGIGRKQAELIKSQKLGSQYFESKGTKLSKQRIELINELISGRAVIEITDLENNLGEATGTKVTIQLPLT